MSDNLDHDQLFKEVLREFFPEFVELFLPDLLGKFDLERVNWLDKELFADPPDGPRHVLDLVAELTAHSGESSLALIHIEIESADSVTDIERRLPEYYFYLRRHSGRPVLPTVVFLKVGLDGIGTREIVERFEGKPVLTLSYQYIGLPALPAADYLGEKNWLGVALSALMKAPRERKIPYGVEAMERLSGAPLTDKQRSLLGDCVEAYIDIPSETSKIFQDILNANATGKVLQMHKTRYQLAIEQGLELGQTQGLEQGLLQGREQGREQGLLRGLRAAIAELSEARFGPSELRFANWLENISDQAELRRVLIAAGTAHSCDEFRKIAGY